jgi:hypothetical protein
MKPEKKRATAKTNLKFKDLKSRKDPKGGAAVDMFNKLDGIKGEYMK